MYLCVLRNENLGYDILILGSLFVQLMSDRTVVDLWRTIRSLQCSPFSPSCEFGKSDNYYYSRSLIVEHLTGVKLLFFLSSKLDLF